MAIKAGGVEAAVKRDLRALPKDLAGSGLAASALALSRELDDPSNSATSKSMCARALADALGELRALKPPAESKDGLDELSAKRLKRVGGAAA